MSLMCHCAWHGKLTVLVVVMDVNVTGPTSGSLDNALGTSSGKKAWNFGLLELGLRDCSSPCGN